MQYAGHTLGDDAIDAILGIVAADRRNGQGRISDHASDAIQAILDRKPADAFDLLEQHLAEPAGKRFGAGLPGKMY